MLLEGLAAGSGPPTALEVELGLAQVWPGRRIHASRTLVLYSYESLRTIVATHTLFDWIL